MKALRYVAHTNGCSLVFVTKEEDPLIAKVKLLHFLNNFKSFSFLSTLFSGLSGLVRENQRNVAKDLVFVDMSIFSLENCKNHFEM